MAMDSKNYIISVQAVLKGDKLVVSGLQQIEGATKKFSQTMVVGGEKTQDFNDILVKAGQRALIVAPIWLAIRSAMMLALSTVSAMIQANMDLEEGMSRIQTVMFGTGAEIEAQMAGIKRTILDTSLTTRVSIKDLTEAFYFLKTSALTAEEALAGFQPLVNIITGTNVKAMEASRGLAGMYNTLGNSLGSNLSVTEKMNKIADVLTYTYAKQDVEMGELIAGYSKVAPYLVGLSDSFTDVVTSIGFLNTHMLRGARAGTLTAQTILNLSKSSKELASVFGITFDSNKPIGLISIIGQMKKALGDTTVITKAQGDALFKIFNIRGGTTPRIFLSYFDKWNEDLIDANKNAEGYAKKIASIRMNTVTSQMAEMSNILGVLTNDFISGVYGVGDFALALKQINEQITTIRPNIEGLGIGIGWVGEQVGRSMAMWSFLLSGNLKMMKFSPAVRSLGEFIDAQQKSVAVAKEDEKIRKADAEKTKIQTEFKINAQKLYDEELKNTYAIMKANGANELDVQKAKVEEFAKAEAKLNRLAEIQRQIEVLAKTANITEQKATNAFAEELAIQESIKTVRDNFGSQADYELAQIQTQNKLLVEQIEYRKKITETLQTVGLDLLKATGVQESVIITMKMRELDLNRKIGDDANYIAQKEALRLSRIQAIVSEKLKERQAQASLILDYQKADENERSRIRRIIELRKMSTREVETQYETNAFDANLIKGNLDKFSEEVKEMVTKKFAEEFKLGVLEDKKDIVEEGAKDRDPQLSENTMALQELTRIMVAISQGSVINAQTAGIPLALNQTTGQYKLPPAEEAYTAPVPLPPGSGYGRKASGEYVNADKSRNSLNLLVELDVKGLKEEMNNVIGDRVKKLIDTDPILQKLLREQVLNKI